MKTKHISSLNGLRALCIFMVIGDHLMFKGFIPKPTSIWGKTIEMVIFNGGLGVGFFFLISGFLITTLLIKEREKSGSISFKNFYIRRSLRIFPAYYFLLAVYFLLQSLGYIHLSSRNWASDLTYSKQFFQDDVFETTHLWSLSVEELFYLVWPVLYVSVFSKISLRYLFGLIFMFSVLRFCNYAYPKYGYSNTIFSTGDALLTGCFLAMNYREISHWVIKHSRLALLAFPMLAFFIFLETYAYHLVSLNDHSSKQMFLLRFALPLCNALFGNKGLFSNILIAIIITYSIHRKNYWYAFLNSRPVNYVGLLSYSIYLWHAIFIEEMPAYQLAIPLILLFTLISAGFSYYLIEKPFLLLKDKFNVMKHLKIEETSVAQTAS